jgi:CPA2 family monovalent cation:H+ antiporter-2
MHSVELILTLTGGLAAALVLGYITQRLGLSPIVGYLIGGTLVGPHTPGFVANAHLAEQLAEIGVILLMFGVGLQFHVEELLAVRRVAIPGAIAQSLAATALGAVIAHAFGWDWTAGIVFGIALSVASTVVLIRVLADNHDLHTPTGHIAVGWLVVEDLFTVIVLVLLPALFPQSHGDGQSAGSSFSWGSLLPTLAITAVKVTTLVGFTLVVGKRAIPWLLDQVAATRSRELFTLTVLVLALGIAVGSALLFGVSMALGAFLAGMVVGRSDYSLRAASEALPMRDAFAVLFFVSVGMLLDPHALIEAPGLIAATLAVVLIGKPLVALVLVLLLRHPFRVALAVAIALAQIGEFSFILSTLGRELGILTAAATNAIVAVSILSIVLNPLLYRSLGVIERSASRSAWLSRLLNVSVGDAAGDNDALATGGGGTRTASTSSQAAPRAVVIGYGPIGRTVTRLLREHGITPTVIDLNVDTVRRLRDEGFPAVYGDAGHRDTLVSAGVEGAVTVILSADVNNAEEVIRLARELNPSLRVLARTAYLRDLDRLRRAGADYVFTSEGEVALTLTEAVLRQISATPEQIDRERTRIHAELFGQSSEMSRPPGPGAPV